MRKQLWIQFAAALLMTALVLGIPAAWYFRPAGKWDEVNKTVEGPFQWCRRGPFWYFCNDQGEPIVKDRWSNTKYKDGYEILLHSYQGGERIALCYGFVGDQKEKWGIIDLQGNVIVERRYDDIRIQQEFPGRAIFKKDGEYGIMDINGKILTENNYEIIYDYSSGFAMCFRDGKWGYLDSEGAEAIEPQFEDTYAMLDNRAIVIVDGLYGMIDEQGTYILEPVYDRVGKRDENGRYEVIKNGVYFKADRDGNLFDSYAYDKQTEFGKNGIAAFSRDGLWGFVDKDGNVIVQPRFEKAKSFGDEEYAIVMENGKYGLLQKDGQYYFPPVCDYLEPYEKAYWTEDKKEYRLLIGDWMLLLNTVTDSLK